MNYWPDAVFEEIVGIPDILNERLADMKVSAILARIKDRHVRNVNTGY